MVEILNAKKKKKKKKERKRKKEKGSSFEERKVRELQMLPWVIRHKGHHFGGSIVLCFL